MHTLIACALFMLLVFGNQSKSDDVTELHTNRKTERDVHFYQLALGSQERRLDSLDAILSATGLLLFTAMTYLLSIDDIRNGSLAPRIIAVALLLPVALTVVGLIAPASLEAPNLKEFNEAAKTDRSGAYEQTQEAMVYAFVANRAAIAAKQAYRNWAMTLGSSLFLIDLLGFVVKW